MGVRASLASGRNSPGGFPLKRKWYYRNSGFSHHICLLLFCTGTLASDGLNSHGSSSATTTAVFHDKDQPGYIILDENESDGGGKVDMDSFSGKLSLNKKKGGLLQHITCL